MTFGPHLVVMPGSSPRLSGLDWSEAEVELSGISDDGWRGIEEGIERSSVHEVGSDEAGEGEWAFDSFGGGVSEAQQQEGDEGDGDLDAHGIFGSPEEVADLEGLLDP